MEEGCVGSVMKEEWSKFSLAKARGGVGLGGLFSLPARAQSPTRAQLPSRNIVYTPREGTALDTSHSDTHNVPVPLCCVLGNLTGAVSMCEERTGMQTEKLGPGWLCSL